MTRKNRTVAAAAILTAVMLGFLLFMAMPTLGGKEIRLPLRPVDPFDPLRGQYLILSYDINDPSRLPGLPTTLPENQSIYVVLETDTRGLSRPVRASTDPLSTGAGQTLMRGHVERGRVSYGIEAYFIERGARLETTLTGAHALIKVLPDGRASVATLMKDGKPLSFIYRERPFWQR